MLINNITLSNFRNYSKAEANFSENLNLIIGKNGQGKTNLIEAIYMLSLGRSFRTNKDKEMMMFDALNTYISSEVTVMGRNYKIEIKLGKDIKKAVKINSIPIDKLTDLLGIINIVIFSPEDLKLVREGPKERRGFMDREISQLRPNYYSLIHKYQKILVQRNNLLKNIKIDENLLDVYDEQLAIVSQKIMAYRKEFIDNITPIASANHYRISSGKEKLNIKYLPNITASSEIDFDSSYIFNKFKTSRAEDMRRRTTTSGPHKDDIGIYLGDMDLRSFGSQGQKRSAAISLKLSEIQLIFEEKNEYPVVLLDDIFSELDISRQKMLIDSLSEIQTFVTTTEAIDFNKEVKTYLIENAKVSLL